jgi:hypothetical protein
MSTANMRYFNTRLARFDCFRSIINRVLFVLLVSTYDGSTVNDASISTHSIQKESRDEIDSQTEAYTRICMYDDCHVFHSKL